MFMRSDTLINIGKRSSIESEIDQALATSKNEKLKRETAFERLRLDISDTAKAGVLPVRRINEYIKLERKLKPEDVRAPLVLSMASHGVQDNGIRRQIDNRDAASFSPQHNDVATERFSARPHSGFQRQALRMRRVLGVIRPRADEAKSASEKDKSPQSYRGEGNP
jgi:hypothetical protein